MLNKCQTGKDTTKCSSLFKEKNEAGKPRNMFSFSYRLSAKIIYASFPEQCNWCLNCQGNVFKLLKLGNLVK